MHEFRNEFIGMQSNTRLLNCNCGIRGGLAISSRQAEDYPRYGMLSSGSRARVLARARAAPQAETWLLFAVVDKLVLHLTLL